MSDPKQSFVRVQRVAACGRTPTFPPGIPDEPKKSQPRTARLAECCLTDPPNKPARLPRNLLFAGVRPRRQTVRCTRHRAATRVAHRAPDRPFARPVRHRRPAPSRLRC